MSMSQEEIEALMSGAGDIAHEDEEPQEDVDTNEEAENAPLENEEKVGSEDEISIENLDETPTQEPFEEDSEPSELADEDNNIDNLDDILAGIDGIVDDESVSKDQSSTQASESTEQSLENMIDQNQYPMPAKDENKVVSQLNQVADDSEEKASQIFDVLSFILDENSEIQNYNKNIGGFIEGQIKLLESLAIKFPNIVIFKDNLESAKELLDSSQMIDSKVNDENNKIFEAMELMQYHDINRQKIERVMSVIRKLNSYLNGIFEDDSDKAEVQIAKHISGDSNETVDADDIESLITEFSEQ